ncbi:unnamed protein product [Pneumocystis jirovecii]|uniref:ML-like domain-containing protein n=1 Tax=Pneumocystis jirovecii TaxID=42068 RepID=L0P8T3_PNEJI|nr:unnamed protein product [Pneumocystis jirovecii]
MRFFAFGWIGLVLLWNNINTRVYARRGIGTQSLSTCMENSGLIATIFRITYYPDMEKVVYRVDGMTSIEGEVLVAYGIQVLNRTIDPCILKIPNLCYLQPGPLTQIEGESDVPLDISSHIPGVVYAIPDIDAIENLKHVFNELDGYLVLLSLSALIVSAIASENGNFNTAHHIATNTFALFSYFQGQAIFGMMSAKMPPIVRSWTQNFQWTMGIINLEFMQKIFTWYIKSTGGAPIFHHYPSFKHSIFVEKRSFVSLEKRASDTVKNIVFRGINRVSYNEGIETTNLFMTSFSFFLIMIFTIVLGFALFRIFLHYSPKTHWIRQERFFGFKNEWKDLLKGAMYRLLLIGYPQLSLLCTWELVSRDSIGAIIYAVLTLIIATTLLVYAAYRVIILARRSLKFHKTAAYILYSDSKVLTKWGSLYIQFSASAYYFTVPLLFFILLRSIFIALSQGNPLVQAIAFFIIQLAYFFLIVYIRPFLDRKTNIFSATVAAINLLNSVFVLIFANESYIYDMIVAIFGIIFFLVNCAFALVLLILLIIVSIYAIVSENPDILHEQMEDDRSEFIKSKTNFSSDVELNLSKQTNGLYFKEMSKIKDPLSSYDGSYSSINKTNNANFDESINYIPSHDLIASYISQNSLAAPPRPPFKSNMRSSNDSLVKDHQTNRKNNDYEYASYGGSNMNSYLPTYKPPSTIQKLHFNHHDSRGISFLDSQPQQYIPGAPKKTRNYGLYHNAYTNKTV